MAHLIAKETFISVGLPHHPGSDTLLFEMGHPCPSG